MIAKLSMALIFAVALAMTSAAMGQQRGSAEQQVADGVRQLVTAYGANDLEKYFTIYAKDMTILRATGRWTHAGPTRDGSRSWGAAAATCRRRSWT